MYLRIYKSVYNCLIGRLRQTLLRTQQGLSWCKTELLTEIKKTTYLFIYSG